MHLKVFIAILDYQEGCLSDNGPCFKLQDFIDFHTKLSILVEKSSTNNNQSVGSMEHMVQTIKQSNILIFRTTDILGINKSHSEILNSRKYRTNIPMVDAHQKSNELKIEKLVGRQLNVPQTGKELAKIPVSTKVLYEKNPDANILKYPKWCKGIISNRSNSRKYQILTDND